MGRHSIVSGLEDSCFVRENQWCGGAVGATILDLSDGGKGFQAEQGAAERSKDFRVLVGSLLSYGYLVSFCSRTMTTFCYDIKDSRTFPRAAKSVPSQVTG